MSRLEDMFEWMTSHGGTLTKAASSQYYLIRLGGVVLTVSEEDLTMCEDPGQVGTMLDRMFKEVKFRSPGEGAGGNSDGEAGGGSTPPASFPGDPG